MVKVWGWAILSRIGLKSMKPIYLVQCGMQLYFVGFRFWLLFPRWLSFRNENRKAGLRVDSLIVEQWESTDNLPVHNCHSNLCAQSNRLACFGPCRDRMFRKSQSIERRQRFRDLHNWEMIYGRSSGIVPSLQPRLCIPLFHPSHVFLFSRIALPFCSTHKSLLSCLNCLLVFPKYFRNHTGRSNRILCASAQGT